MILRLAVVCLCAGVFSQECGSFVPKGDDGSHIAVYWKNAAPATSYAVYLCIASVGGKTVAPSDFRLYAAGDASDMRLKEMADSNCFGTVADVRKLCEVFGDIDEMKEVKSSLSSFPRGLVLGFNVYAVVEQPELPEKLPEGTFFPGLRLLCSGSGSNAYSWFDSKKLNLFVAMMVLSLIIGLTIILGRNQTYTLRKVPALAAIDEALGRATEMGKPVLFLVGLEELKKVSTLAALSILENVAERCAKFGTQLKVPHRDPVVFTVAQEATKQAYLRAGRPDLYKDDINFFITDDQFGFTAAVDGIMLREKPAACIYMGYYWAESLILSETGASIGAIQIAGTDAEHQLPFFVSACDHTLIGEELYAAAAYLSGDKNLISTLRAQDIIKGIVVTLAIASFVGGMLTVCDVKFMQPCLDWIFNQ